MRPKIKISRLHFSYNSTVVLDDISVQFEQNTITAITGPSGRGKSTFLMVLNRLWESVATARMNGRVMVRLNNDWQDVYAPSLPLAELRRKIGMVFQTPNPLPMSIGANVSFPLKLAGRKDKAEIRERVDSALKHAFLWDEVKNRLGEDARTLSGGQQQRLCIARALILEPEVLLLDEPTSSLDENASAVIEDLLLHLKNRCTILMVSHYLGQVQRIADRVLVLSKGKFV